MFVEPLEGDSGAQSAPTLEGGARLGQHALLPTTPPTRLHNAGRLLSKFRLISL